jgi:hypothetical protein
MNTSLLVAESLTNKDVFISFIEINNSKQLAKKIRTSLSSTPPSKNSHGIQIRTKPWPRPKSPPLSQFLADFFTSSTKIHLQDLTRAIGDSALNVVQRFYYGGDLHPARAIQKTPKKNSRGATSQKAPPSVNSWPIASSRAPKSISRTRRGRSVTAL